MHETWYLKVLITHHDCLCYRVCYDPDIKELVALRMKMFKEQATREEGGEDDGVPWSQVMKQGTAASMGEENTTIHDFKQAASVFLVQNKTFSPPFTFLYTNFPLLHHNISNFYIISDLAACYVMLFLYNCHIICISLAKPLFLMHW